VRRPVLLILGRRDVMTPPRAASMLQKLPNVQTQLVELSGHSLMAEAPDAVLDALIRFMS
jgi:pimeloyl-ACP methyl ester carboxylesterase